MKEKVFVITAAGGNGTAIRILDKALSRADYAKQGVQLGREMERFDAEQAGFLILNDNHFEMAGGEFCGNAARSVAILFSEIQQKPQVKFTMSGYSGTVTAKVRKTGNTSYSVECIFPALSVSWDNVKLSSGHEAALVDLGGIIHMVIEGLFSSEKKAYQEKHKAIVREFNLENRKAVGVVWIERTNQGVKMHPVVYIKDVDTLFYEKSCGSAAIAVAKVTGASLVIQPTGKKIKVKITDKETVLESDMEIVYSR